MTGYIKKSYYTAPLFFSIFYENFYIIDSCGYVVYKSIYGTLGIYICFSLFF